MRRAKALSVLAVLIFAVFNFTSTAFAFDIIHPDISVKIISPDKFMPNSTYFIGIKYIVNATTFGYEPAVDPEIIFNVQNAEIVGNLSGIFDVVEETAHSCIFRLYGEIEEKRSEIVVVVIKTGSSGNVNMDVTAKAHDRNNYNYIITRTDSISVPILKLKSNSTEYFKELAEHRKAMFEQYLYLVNETLYGTVSEVKKISDEVMQTALLKITSACYEMALKETISSGLGSFLDYTIGIQLYDYMDFTREVINGFEDNPLFIPMRWIFKYNYVMSMIDRMALDISIRQMFSTYECSCGVCSYPAYCLSHYISLIDEEMTCWNNTDFDCLRNILSEEKEFRKYANCFRAVSTGICEESFPEDTITYVRLLYGSIAKSLDADCTLIERYIEPATKEPKPRFVSVPSSNINLGEGDEYELVFKIKNDGGTASDSYFSLSVSDGLNITGYSSDKPNGVFSIYHKGDLIWYRDEYQIPANYTLLDWYRPWLGAGEEQTLKVKIKGTQNGAQWVKYRLAFRPLLENLSFVRNPTSGELDQQGWHAYKIEVNVINITNHKPIADFSYTVNNMSVEFTSLSTDPDGDALSYYWDFDDGSNSTEENPVHEYRKGGYYNVTLTVTDTEGLSDYKTKVVRVNEKPIADFVCLANKTDVTFISTSTDDGSIVSWKWDFGDGETGSGEIVHHSYSSEGIYNVTLTVIDNEGASDTVTKEVSAVLTIFIRGEDAKRKMNLSSVSIPTLSTPIRDIFISNADASLYWNLSAVDIPTKSSPLTRIFVSNEDPGFVINLTDVDIPTKTSPTKEIFISNADASDCETLLPLDLNDTTPPVITNITVTNIASNSATIKWDTDELASSLVRYGEASGIYTDSKSDSRFVKNHIINLTGLSPNTTYYFVVISTDIYGNSAESSEHRFTTAGTINHLPIASFTYSPQSPMVGIEVIFDASSSYDPDGNITKYEWDFGDGNVTDTTDAIITHIFSSAGNYMVNLTVMDDSGAINSTSKVITVRSSLTEIFDTGAPTNPYPSISGTFNGTIKPNRTIIATKLYTYACEGTGGHTEYARIFTHTWEAVAEWNGYKGDWHNITFNKPVILLPNEKYNITIITGSYPMIHHKKSLKTESGWINCTEFRDVNGRKYYDWIPAIALY